MRGYAAIGLHRPQKNVNIGSALRACGCYGASFMAISGRDYSKCCSDTQNRYKHMPLFQVDDLRNIIPKECTPVAVDILPEATILKEYNHPERAFYIFGPENGTLGDDVLEWCSDKIYIPTEFCMNLAATVNVVLYDRMCR